MAVIIKNGKTYGDRSVSLTQAEYNALSETEKNNGTVYYIYDVNTAVHAADVLVGAGTLADFLAGSSFTILANGWGNATTINETTYYPYVINLTKIYDVHPVIGIGASGVLPTDAEQEAFNAWKYAVVDDVNLTLTLYAEEIPTNDFTIVTKGVA